MNAAIGPSNTSNPEPEVSTPKSKAVPLTTTVAPGKKMESPGTASSKEVTFEEEAQSETTSAEFTQVEELSRQMESTQMEIERLEKETGQTSDYALHEMMRKVYETMWQGSKTATIQAMMSQAKEEEMSAILEFARTIPDT